jgi:hypothetical protein
MTTIDLLIVKQRNALYTHIYILILYTHELISNLDRRALLPKTKKCNRKIFYNHGIIISEFKYNNIEKM